MTKREKQKKMTESLVLNLYDVLRGGLDTDVFRTGDGLQTLTFSIGTVDGVERFASLKLTVHKEDYDLDEEIEKFEERLWEEERKAEEKKRKEAKKGAKAADNGEKAE